jgi:hypothetical protein
VPGALGRIVPPDWQHVENFPLTALTFPVRSTPAVIGVNWYVEFDEPEQDSQGHWWIARDGKLTKIRAGHCVCLKERSGPDLDQWWDFYDQGAEGACVGFGVSRVASHLNKKIYDARWLYHEAQKIDSRPGEDYVGTTVRAGLDILRKRGHRVVGPDGVAARPDIAEGIVANRWAQNIEDVLHVLGYTGLDYVDIMNSWGRGGYPHLVRMPASVLDRLRREEGEIGLVTDR